MNFERERKREKDGGGRNFDFSLWKGKIKVVE